MKNTIAKALCLIAATSIYLVAVKQTQATAEEKTDHLTYSTHGNGPSILLMHDSSRADQDWVNAAKRLADKFEVTLVDITAYLHDSQGVQRLRESLRRLEISDARIAGSAHAEKLALHYAQSQPKQSQSFVLPHNSEDLEILADLLTSTTLTNS